MLEKHHSATMEEMTAHRLEPSQKEHSKAAHSLLAAKLVKGNGTPREAPLTIPDIDRLLGSSGRERESQAADTPSRNLDDG